MADNARTLFLSNDDDFDGPLTPTEAKDLIAIGIREGKDVDEWDLYEKVDFNTKVDVEIRRRGDK